MSNPGEYESLRRLEIEIEAELTLAGSGYQQDVPDTPVTEWLVDPTDGDRYEVGLRGLLDAVNAVEDAMFPNAGPEQS